ncbi:MAG: ATP-binding cassette domain-containing protein [Planctomycetes bacterium]|nr:ATP-binding cassette domain-containing protein [Planctomycetota bacterium]
MIHIDQLAVRLGQFRLDNLSFEVAQGDYAVLMGRTGAGKTTVQECICGLRPVTSGRIILAGRDVTRLPPAQRDVGYVPQDAALFPTMTVRQHLAFALEIRHWGIAERLRRVAELSELLSIEHLLERYPAGLSGGEKQRVALGRALAFRPGILLLDEPLSALDEETRQQMYGLLTRVKEHTHVTTLHITHNREDADHLADCVLLLADGQIRRMDKEEQPVELKVAQP